VTTKSESLRVAKKLFSELEDSGLLIPNSWLRKQNDLHDRQTNGIYKCKSKADLESLAQHQSWSPELVGYAAHRWRNFMRHDAWLFLIDALLDEVSLSKQSKSKTEDFILKVGENKFEFDLKVTRFPKQLPEDTSDFELAKWYYLNQSREGRHHFANRFFIVGNPELSLYEFDKSVETILKFKKDMSRFRHFISLPGNTIARAVLLRQH